MAIRILNYLAQNPRRGLWYHRIRKPGEDLICRIVAYSDSDYASCQATRRSISAHAIFVNECLVAFLSRQQKLLALSTCEAELIALTLTAKQILWLRKLANSFYFPQRTGYVYEDNKQLSS